MSVSRCGFGGCAEFSLIHSLAFSNPLYAAERPALFALEGGAIRVRSGFAFLGLLLD